MTLPLGELAAFGAGVVWAVSTCIYRTFGRYYHPQSVTLFKCAIASLLLLATLVAFGEPFPTELRTWVLIGLSGVLGIALADSFYYAALFVIGSQRALALQAMTPVATPLVAWAALGETISAVQSLGIFIATSAIVLLVISQAKASRNVEHPFTTAEWSRGVIFSILAIVLSAFALVIFRFSVSDVHPISGTLMRLLPAGIVLLAVEYRVPSDRNCLALISNRKMFFPLLVGAVVGTFLGFILATARMRFATSTGVASMLLYARAIWVVPISYLFFGETVSRENVFLTCVAALGVMLLFI